MERLEDKCIDSRVGLRFSPHSFQVVAKLLGHSLHSPFCASFYTTELTVLCLLGNKQKTSVCAQTAKKKKSPHHMLNAI
jgi:hypothetical protein